jgi:GH24 family phage-related lysozyme (muramidase)
MKKIIIFSLIIFICAIYFYKERRMKIGPEEAARIRDELHNLDIRGFDDRKIYYDKLYYIIASGEGFSSTAYKDSHGLWTIGYGFNMDRGGASRREWNEIFEGLISFDDAKSGKIQITEEQGRMLKRYGVEKREKELSEIYSSCWDKMRLNERAILTDLYYQAPSLANGKTRISNHIEEYYRTGVEDYLQLAVTEVQLYSSHSPDPATRIGLQNRNNIRAIILDSRKSPLYSNPKDELIPEIKKIEIIPGKTVISREISDKFPKSNNHGDYYIWRTKMDGKVRASHQELEGKVFKYEDKNMKHPEEDPGCRCKAERLPIHAKIIEEEKDESLEEDLKQDDFSDVIIRKHITNLAELPGFYIK